MHVSISYYEFDDVTPHIETSATVNENGKVTDASVSLFPYGDHRERIMSGNAMQPNPVHMIMSLEEAEVLARLLTGAVTDAKNGRFDEIERE